MCGWEPGSPEEPGWGGAGVGADTCADPGPWEGAGAGGRLLPRGPAMPKVCSQASEVGAVGFTAVESETGCEEAVRGTGVTATPLVWPQMEDGIHV